MVARDGPSNSSDGWKDEVGKYINSLHYVLDYTVSSSSSVTRRVFTATVKLTPACRSGVSQDRRLESQHVCHEGIY